MLKNIKISTKLILFFLFVTVLPIILISAYSYKNSSAALLKESLFHEESDLEKVSHSIDTLLKHFEADIAILHDFETLHKMLNEENITPTSTLKKDATQDFFNFAKKHDFYYQIRYIDETGQEVIRIDQTGLYEPPFLVPEKDLQNKFDRYYFKDVMILAENDLYISELDLNIERGEVENRGTKEKPEYVPVLRLAMPVFNDNRDRKGIIITNIYADILLNILEEEKYDHEESKNNIEPGKKSGLVNKDGYFLFNEDKDLTWGFMFENENTIFKTNPSFADKIYKKNQGQFFDTETNDYITFKKISFVNEQKLTNTVFKPKEDSWILYTEIEKTVVYNPILKSLYIEILISALIIFFTIILSILLGRSITKPIKKLKNDINIIKSGNLKHKVYISGKDEIGELGKSINELRKQLIKSKTHTNKKLTKHSEELDKLNSFLMGRELKMIKMKEQLKKIKKEDK